MTIEFKDLERAEIAKRACAISASIRKIDETLLMAKPCPKCNSTSKRWYDEPFSFKKERVIECENCGYSFPFDIFTYTEEIDELSWKIAERQVKK